MSANTNAVTIARDEQGNVIRVSKNNPEYGCVRLVQAKVAVGTNGWVRNNNLSTLIHGKVEDLQALNLEDKETIPGTIYIREQLEPFSSDNPDRDLKIAGDTGIVCCRHGEPIYRKSFYSANADETNQLIAHTNGDDIRNANSGFTAEDDVIDQVVEDEVKTKSKAKKEEVKEEEEVEMEEETFEL